MRENTNRWRVVLFSFFLGRCQRWWMSALDLKRVEFQLYQGLCPWPEIHLQEHWRHAFDHAKWHLWSISPEVCFAFSFLLGRFLQSFRRFWLARCKSCKTQDCTSATVCCTVDLFLHFWRVQKHVCQVRPAGVVGHGFQAILLISGPLLHQSMKPNLTRPRTYDIHSIWFYRSQCITPPIQDSLNVDHVRYCGIVIEIVFLTVSDLWKLPASGLPHQSYGLSPGAAVRHGLVWWHGLIPFFFFARLPLVWAIQP